jgi:2-iminobutanoate/2-iminopropanoate deaminase
VSHQALSTDKAPAAIGPYSQAVRAGRQVFVSGQIPLTPEGTIVPGGVPEQTERCLLNVKAVLEAAGLGLEHVAKTTVYMTDLAQFTAMNEVYARYFKAPYPARATLGVDALPKGAAVEIEAVASAD